MSMASSIVLFAQTPVEDWAAQIGYHNATIDFFDSADALKVDGSNRVVVAGSGSSGTGIGCLNKFSTFTGISGSNGFTVSGGSTFSPDATLMKDNSGDVYALYTLTHDSPVSGTTTSSFTILSLNSTTGAGSSYIHGRGAYSFSDSPTTTMTTGAFDSSDNFYGAGLIRESGTTEYPYLVKYNTSAAVQWSVCLQPNKSKAANAPYCTLASGVVVDSSGNSYITVRHYESPPSSAFSLKLLKYNASGTQQFVRVINSDSAGSNIQATDGTNIYAVNTSGVITAFSCSTGAIVWQRQITTLGSITNANLVLFSSNLYVGFFGSNNKMYLVKMDTSGTLDWNRELDAGSSAPNFLTGKLQDVTSNKMYCLFEGPVSAQGVTVVKLPIDGTKTGSYVLPNIISIGGAEPYTYSPADDTIVYASGSLSASAFSSGTSTSSTLSDTTTSGFTTSDVTQVSYSVAVTQSGINSALAPTNVNDPVTLFAKRTIV